LEGSLEASGESEQLLETARAEGHLRARSIAFSPDSEFSTVVACFEWQAGRWKLPIVEVTQAGETYIGTGASQTDGKLLLDVAKGSRQLHLAGTLFASLP
jgi:hypothetical protein